MKKKTKIFSIISSLSEKEIRQMRKMLKSPFFTHRTDLLDLFNCLVSYTVQRKPLPKSEVLYKKVYDNADFNALRLRGAMSELKTLIEECWIINALRADKIKSKLLVSDIYRRRKLNRCYESNLNKTRQLLNNHPKRNADYYLNILDFEKDQMKYQSSTKRTEHLFLQEISDTNDVLYLIQKLQNACAQLSHQLVYKTDYDKGLLSNLLEVIKQDKYLKIPAIAIYYYCFLFLTEENSEIYFRKFKDQLFKYRHHFTKEDLGAPFRLALNLCIRKTNEGVISFIRDGWELYKEGLAEGILYENDHIPRFTFNNAIANALLVKEFDWINNFILEATPKLEATFREQTISFNLARLEFARKNYGKALVHLQSSEYKDLVNSLISKMLLIKIYVELKEYESLNSQLESFEKFVRRREVSDYHRQTFLNAIRYVNKIIALPTFAKEKRAALRVKIANEQILTERAWLLEKLDR